ncbi:pantoate--beta-alanine ligase [Alloprevotella sp. OH1205_COT-284]|uniref:pantoate--beta-alanine ligase n=1 Tax=Alloprevotella sp. OH1205_COT-284 TaxID=2491043 RepID=UPI000F5E1C28|nr:pantoate--beta-alanine ligase [Alloprevotella sp. OH1205_COT-284]RRD79484.1 pantoate--beta-alanine ligase [Alloprevotella sp. OH1205_COT-284]
MYIIHSVQELKQLVSAAKSAGKTVGLVPTMGALHEGHASLIDRSVKECDTTVVSVFVNPTQFNDPNDLNHYPRTLDADCRLIEERGGDIVFAPSVEEIYPAPDTRVFSYPPIDTVMEGAKRPGHFNGVCQVVSKLFEMTTPDRAYFGEKDFQQIAVIRAMMKDLGFDFNLVACPIVREESGLALSSRNALLSEDERETAASIGKVLFESRRQMADRDVRATHDFVVNALNAIDGLEVEYFDIVNADTLQPVAAWDEAQRVQGCITVFCGKRPVRLIDNIAYKAS